MSENDVTALSGRCERLIGALSNAILSTAEVAAERIELASKLAQVQQRMSAFGAVLEAVGAQKAVLTERLEAAHGPTRLLLMAQLNALTAQELAVLDKAGIPGDYARTALAEVDEPVYKRVGKKFERVEAAPALANGHAAG